MNDLNSGTYKIPRKKKASPLTDSTTLLNESFQNLTLSTITGSAKKKDRYKNKHGGKKGTDKFSEFKYKSSSSDKQTTYQQNSYKHFDQGKDKCRSFSELHKGRDISVLKRTPPRLKPSSSQKSVHPPIGADRSGNSGSGKGVIYNTMIQFPIKFHKTILQKDSRIRAIVEKQFYRNNTRVSMISLYFNELNYLKYEVNSELSMVVVESVEYDLSRVAKNFGKEGFESWLDEKSNGWKLGSSFGSKSAGYRRILNAFNKLQDVYKVLATIADKKHNIRDLLYKNEFEKCERLKKSSHLTDMVSSVRDFVEYFKFEDEVLKRNNSRNNGVRIKYPSHFFPSFSTLSPSLQNHRTKCWMNVVTQYDSLWKSNSSLGPACFIHWKTRGSKNQYPLTFFIEEVMEEVITAFIIIIHIIFDYLACDAECTRNGDSIGSIWYESSKRRSVDWETSKDCLLFGFKIQHN